MNSVYGNTITHKATYILVLIGIGILCFLIGKSLFTTYPILLHWQPEPYTELFFTDHLELPKEVTLNEDTAFSFTVHNRENKHIDYSYTVTLEDAHNMATVGSGVLSLDDHQSVDVIQHFSVDMPDDHYTINVTLHDHPEKIHFSFET